MTAGTPWAKLAEHFPDSEVKQRPGAAKWDHKASCEGPRCRQAKDPAAHVQFSYVDARAVMQRLDDVLTPEGWEFTSSVLPGTDVVHGRLTVAGVVREDFGYPNSDRDEEPIKAASSDALKRCAVMFGIGRHLYDDNSQSGGRVSSPARPSARPDPYTPRPVITDAVPEEPPDLFPPIGQPANAVPTDECPIHHEKWRGDPGDLYHGPKGVVDGGYCRHPDNVKRTARRAS